MVAQELNSPKVSTRSSGILSQNTVLLSSISDSSCLRLCRKLEIRGLSKQFWSFLRILKPRVLLPSSYKSNARSSDSYLIDAVREALVNTVVHRDYTLEGTDIEVSLYSDRLEVISPGRLPNGVTVEKIKKGMVRVSRNALFKEILRDYDYIERYGIGVRKRIIESMWRHNRTEPDLVEQENRFLVQMWKKPNESGEP